MAKANEGDKATAVMDEIGVEHFYHVGLLPATTPVVWPVQERDVIGATNKVIGTPWEMWSNPEAVKVTNGFPCFIAKARQYHVLDVRGMHFPGTSQYVEMGPTSANRTNYAGDVVKLDGDTLKKVIASCYRYFLRYPNGFYKMDDPTTPVEIVNLDFGKKPEGFDEKSWIEYAAKNGAPERPKFQPKTDKPFAEFVYIRKLDAELQPTEMEDYRKNPRRFHHSWIGTPTRSFFESPPKSVSEMYPQEKLGG